MKFLERNLEQEFIDNWDDVCAAIYQYVWMDRTYYWHREKKQMLNGMELIFYDRQLAMELENREEMEVRS